ncbi:lipopolysaccharide biosynthesis protein [Vibrio splendidus]
MENIKNKALSGAMWSILDKLINQAGSFILLIYLSRVLSPSDFGLIAMLSIFLAISQSLINSGFSQALIQKSNNVSEEDLSTVFYINLVISILLYAILYFLAPSVAEFYNQPELVILSRILFIIIIINSIALVPRSKLIIEIDFRTQSISNSIAMIFSSIVAIYMVKNDYGYWSLVGMNLAKSLINSILLIFFSKWHPKFIFSTKSFKDLFSFGSNLLIAGIIATTVQNLYSVLIGKFFNATQVGYFQQGFNYTNLLSTTLSSVVQGVTYPIMSSIQDDEIRLVKIYIRVMGIVTLITFPIFVGFAGVAQEFVLIFLGEKWIPIIPVLMVLSIARTVTPISALNLNILNAKGRSDLYLKSDFMKLPISIIALLFAVPYGIEAVAISQLFFTTISFFINAYYPGKLFGFGAVQQLKKIYPTIIASLFMYLCISWVHLDSILLQMIVKIVVGIGVYTSLCWFFKFPAFIDVKNLIFRRLGK